MLDESSLYRHINVLGYAYHVRGGWFLVFKNAIIAHLDYECSHWHFERRFSKVVFLKEDTMGAFHTREITFFSYNSQTLLGFFVSGLVRMTTRKGIALQTIP